VSDPVAGDDRIVVLVPTYNEAENVGPLAERVLAADPRLELLVVDDASPDGTGMIASELASANPRIHVMNRTGQRGYALASAEGIRWCVDQGFTTVCTMDGDLSHDPARLPAMLAARDSGADVVIGSRYTPGGGVEAQWGPIRRAISEGGSRYARAMIGTRVRDCTSGYRCYGPAALAALHLDELHSDGYSFLIEVLAQLSDAGLEIEEVPIVYIDRQHGSSKISRRIVLEALGQTTLLGVRRFYANHGDKLRYVVAGVFNTVVGYTFFLATLFVLKPTLGGAAGSSSGGLAFLGRNYYIFAQWISWALSVPIGTASMKYYAFRSKGRYAHQVFRAYFVYLPAQGINTLLLWTLVTFAHLSPPVAQIGALLFATVFSYIGHKYFTFRVPLETGEVVSEEMLD
jgi:dolichol-phosphate mannosyltransferase